MVNMSNISKSNIKKFFGHLRNIIVHKYWVFHYGRQIGVGCWQLLMHDMSKFSPVEFFESIEFYQGTSSPIPPCKKANGFSKAWQHHKGRNPHHYEYWTDNYDSGTTLIPMPLQYLEELLADWMAAGRTYQGKSFNFAGQAEWWKNKKTTNPAIHPLTIALIDTFFRNGIAAWRHSELTQLEKSLYNLHLKNKYW